MNQENIGKFLSETRKQKGMTQRELAEKIGISDKTISKWECGNSIPDISYLEALCNSLDITVNELLSGEQLSEKSYSKKAEENIMALMKENEIQKKGSFWSMILGAGLGIFAFVLMIFAGSSMGGGLTTLGPNLAVCILTPLYAVAAYLIITLIKERHTQ